jgi:hypothetical protein
MKKIIQRFLSWLFPIRPKNEWEAVFGDSAIRLKGKGR